MGKRLKPAQIEERMHLKEALIQVLRQYPEGCYTAYAAEAIGCAPGLAMKLLTDLAKDGMIGRKFIYRSTDHNRLALWFPDPGRGVEVNPGITSQSRRREACDFTPYPDFEADHERWMQKATAKPLRANPCGPGRTGARRCSSY